MNKKVLILLAGIIVVIGGIFGFAQLNQPKKMRPSGQEP